MSHVTNWRKKVPGRGNRQCKGPEVACLECLRSSKEASCWGVRGRFSVMGGEIIEATSNYSRYGLEGQCELAFPLSEMGGTGGF